MLHLQVVMKCFVLWSW